MSAHIFVSSTITGETIRYFVPSLVGKADFSSFGPTQFIERCAKAPVSQAPLAAILAMRGRSVLSADVVAKARSLMTLQNLWYGKGLDAASLCSLHASAIGRKSPSCLRDSAVWVDGLRPKDAALFPCPASMVPGLLADYFAFMARTDVPHWIRLAIGHYQLLMIHPFFDGNGRLSRLIALLHAQRFLPRMAMIIAASLALQRRTLRSALDIMRQGDVEAYLAQWSRLLSSCESAMVAIENFGRIAKSQLSEMLDTSETSHRFVRLVLHEPIFTQDNFATNVGLSDRLTRAWLQKRIQSGMIEPHVGNGGTLEYHCPTAVEFWRRAMQSLNAACAENSAFDEHAVGITTPSL